MSNKSQRKEKQHWEEEKAKPNNAQRLSGIYFVDLEDKEFNETLKNCAEEVGSAHGLCNAVHIPKDLRELILEGADGSTRGNS